MKEEKIKKENKINEIKEEKNKVNKDALEKEINLLKETNANLTNSNQALNDKVLRLSAEIQNIGKRHNEEMANMAKYEGIELVKNLLPIVDNFERSIAMDTSIDEKYLAGYKMIYTNLINLLNNIGVTPIDCLEKPFDPKTMQAILTEKVEGKDKDIVLLEMQKGYLYKDKLLRPAMVKVSE